MVGKPSRMCEIGGEAHPDVREWSGVPPGCPGVVGRPSRISGSSREALLISGSDQETLTDGREALPDVRK